MASNNKEVSTYWQDSFKSSLDFDLCKDYTTRF